MAKKTVRASAIVAALLSVAAASGCSKDGKSSETAERAEATSGEMTQKESLKATVEAVDQQARIVTLRDPEGHRFMVEAGEGVALDKLKPNDEVRAVYQESVAFSLQDPAAAASSDQPTTTEESSRKQGPDGVQFGRQIRTTVQIVAIAPEGASATFRAPEGYVRTVEIEDPKHREKVANLKPGDSVAVTYTEKLALAVDNDR